MIRQGIIILLSCLVVGVSALGMYAIWLIASHLTPFWRGIVSLIVWVVTFAFGATMFWKTVESLEVPWTVKS
jgi:hypothetical protein